MRVILFNLFPYRDLRQAKRRKRVVTEIVVGVLLGVMLCFAVSNEFSEREAMKTQFLDNLSAMEAEMATRVLEVQNKKDRVADLTRQVNALQAVEKESLLASQWLSYLDGSVPPTVSLTRVLVKDDVMLVNGFTSSVGSLSKWVDQMEAGNVLFESVDLVSLIEPTNVEANTVSKDHQFEIKAMLRGGQNAPR